MKLRYLFLMSFLCTLSLLSSCAWHGLRVGLAR